MSAIPTLNQETWCYKDLDSPVGARAIFNADDVRPELSAIVESDGVVTHGSLNKGKVTTHRVQGSELNPLPVPLAEPRALAPLSIEAVGLDLDKVDNMIRSLSTSSREDLPSLAVQEGTFRAYVPNDRLPWRGYWWSYKMNYLAGGYGSPLAKYDRYVKSRTGVMPRVQSWENTYHKYKGINWEGHCNGWAASAVLRAEPRVSRFYAPAGIKFSVSDQKGILAEEDYCARATFYGKRNYGKAGNDPRDIYPADFHKVLSYYIGNLGKVVATDYMSSRSVDNHLISGYNFEITKKSADTYYVVASIQMHKYDAGPSQNPGVAPIYTRTYKYYLKVDGAGVPVGGSWVSANPDFIWVPLAPMDCSANNPRMTQTFTSEILNLPPIQ